MFKYRKYVSKKNRRKFVISIIIVRVLYIFSPIIMSLFIDAVIDKNYKQMIVFLCLDLLSLVISLIINYFYDYYEKECEKSIFINLNKMVLHKINEMDFKTASFKNSEINQLLGQDYEKSKSFFYINQVRFIVYCIVVVSIFCIMFYYNWIVALTLLFTTTFFIILSNTTGKTINEKSKQMLNASEDIKEYVSDKNDLAKEERTLKNKYLKEEKENYLFDDYSKKFKRHNKAESFFLNIISYGLLNLQISLSTILCGYLVYKGSMTIGVLYMFDLYTSQLWNPGEFIFNYRAKSKSVKPIFEKIKKYEEIKETKYKNNESILKIELKDFIILNNSGKNTCLPINFSFEKGHIYVIKGDNGIGKTTLVESLLGYSKRYTGSIKYNYKDKVLNDFVYIPAVPYISTYFMKNNKLSSGQKKKIQLYHDIKENATVQIFDEPTNYLDKTIKENFINDLLKVDVTNKIILIISHDEIFNDKGFINLTIKK